MKRYWGGGGKGDNVPDIYETPWVTWCMVTQCGLPGGCSVILSFNAKALKRGHFFLYILNITSIYNMAYSREYTMFHILCNVTLKRLTGTIINSNN